MTSFMEAPVVPGSRLVSPPTLSDLESELVGEELLSPILPESGGRRESVITKLLNH